MSYEIRPLATTRVRTRALPLAGLAAQGLPQFLHLQTREVRCAPHTHSYDTMALLVCQVSCPSADRCTWGQFEELDIWGTRSGREQSTKVNI